MKMSNVMAAKRGLGFRALNHKVGVWGLPTRQRFLKVSRIVLH